MLRPVVCVVATLSAVLGGFVDRSAAPAAPNAVRWSITDLGSLGGRGSQALAIDDAGHVVGVAETVTRFQHAALWTAQGRSVDLGTLGGTQSVARGVNLAGQVAGISYIGTALTIHAFLWSGGKLTDLGTLGGPSSSAVAVNASGQVAGAARTTSPQTHAFFWQRSSGMRDLGTLGGTLSLSAGINTAGTIAGYSYTAGNAGIRGFVWTASGGMRDLGVPPQFAHATVGGINDRGDVVGTGYSANGRTSHGLVWSGGTIKDVGALPGDSFSQLDAVNELGEAAGNSSATATGPQRPFLWTGARLVPLSTLLPGGSGWTLTRVSSLNDLGELVGTGIHDGRATAFLLSPPPRDQLSRLVRLARAAKLPAAQLRLVAQVRGAAGCSLLGRFAASVRHQRVRAAASRVLDHLCSSRPVRIL
jgi:probable HAF family extracellular repeat protein